MFFGLEVAQDVGMAALEQHPSSCHGRRNGIEVQSRAVRRLQTAEEESRCTVEVKEVVPVVAKVWGKALRNRDGWVASWPPLGQ